MDAEKQLGRGSEVFGLIHGDLSFGNILFNASDVLPIDFDDCGFGYFLYDLAVVLAGPWARERPDYEECKRKLLQNYQPGGRSLREEEVRLLPLFMTARFISGYLWEAARLPTDGPTHDWKEQQQRVQSLLAAASAVFLKL